MEGQVEIDVIDVAICHAEELRCSSARLVEAQDYNVVVKRHARLRVQCEGLRVAGYARARVWGLERFTFR